MSWEAYSNILRDRGAIYYGIYSKEGAVCAQGPNMKVSYEEILKLANCLAKKDSSFSVNGEPCVMIFSDDEMLQGKTKSTCHENQKIFYHCEATRTLLVLVGMAGANEREASVIANAGATQIKAVGY